MDHDSAPSPPVGAAAALDALRRCADECRRCASACLDERPVEPMVDCIRADEVCAELCEVTARLLARGASVPTPVASALLDACVLACRTCAEECERHEHDHCRRCAMACRECEHACLRLQRAGHTSPADD